MNTPQAFDAVPDDARSPSGEVLSFLLEQFQRDLWTLAQVLPSQQEQALQEIGLALETTMRTRLGASEHHALVVRHYYCESLRHCVKNVRVIVPPTDKTITTH